MQAFIPALQNALGLGNVEFATFLNKMQEHKAVIAGSFPLYFTCQLQVSDWHRDTRREVVHLAWLGKQRGTLLPQPALERIGNWLQVAPLQHDWATGRMDIDIFVADPICSPADLGLHVWPRCYDEELGKEGLYAILPHVLDERVWRKGSTAVNIINLYGITPVKFVHRYFDFDFCKATFDGELSGVQRMRGLANVEKYKKILDYLLMRIGDWDAYGNLPGLSREEFCALARQLGKTMAARLAKYERRRFTVENAEALRGLIKEASTFYF